MFRSLEKNELSELPDRNWLPCSYSRLEYRSNHDRQTISCVISVDAIRGNGDTYNAVETGASIEPDPVVTIMGGPVLATELWEAA